jgi:tetratricopeptide (TPR) repeat protein
VVARRCLPLALVLCLIAAGAPRALAQSRRAPGSGLQLPQIEQVEAGRLERLERWLKAVARHIPGEDDAALEEVAGWPSTSLRQLWIDVSVLGQIMQGHSSNRFTVGTEGQKTSVQIRYTKTQLQRLAVLACAAGGSLTDPPCIAMKASAELDEDFRQLSVLARNAKVRGDDNYIVRRGALLHGDIPVLAPQAMIADPPSSSAGPQRLRMAISDGRELDLRQSAVHWELARMLLDFVKTKGSSRPDPGRDPMVRAWYRATAAWMQLREDHDELHIARARELFPDDPDILFLSACQHEAYAGSPIQAAVRSAVLPTGVTMGVGSAQLELRLAEQFFRRTLEVKPDHAEARMREGRVLGLLGKHAEAAIALRLAVTELPEIEQRYYAEQFLGAEEEALGNREAAQAAYERAAVLCPRAQSPLLALSQLARRYGDRGAALRAMDRLFTLQDEERDQHDDPWWQYYVAQARDADDLLEAMQQPYLTERLQ